MERSGIAVVLVTHTRKMEAEDPLEAISGTNGVTGAADAVLVLNRDAKGTTLYGRGRDIEEIETAMRFDGGRWSVLGDADEVRKSDERRKIVAALKEAGDELARPIREGTVFLIRMTRPQASSDEAHRIAFGFSPPVTIGTLQRA
jgi:hypothetical protein